MGTHTHKYTNTLEPTRNYGDCSGCGLLQYRTHTLTDIRDVPIRIRCVCYDNRPGKVRATRAIRIIMDRIVERNASKGQASVFVVHNITTTTTTSTTTPQRPHVVSATAFELQ